MRTIIFVAAVCCSIGGPVNSVSAATRVGERYPDFTLSDIASGKAVSLSDFRGKRVLLVQFASW
jgi:peroxiredoxin